MLKSSSETYVMEGQLGSLKGALSVNNTHSHTHTHTLVSCTGGDESYTSKLQQSPESWTAAKQKGMSGQHSRE
jgi:hypothetical protein